MLHMLKDKTLSAGAKMALNSFIKDYGEIVKLNLDSKHKSMDLEIELDGESENLIVNIGHYEITKDNHLKISSITASKKWINTLFAKYLEGKEFEIPKKYAKIVKSIV